jgi:hypothetical protein
VGFLQLQVEVDRASGGNGTLAGSELAANHLKILNQKFVTILKTNK